MITNKTHRRQLKIVVGILALSCTLAFTAAAVNTRAHQDTSKIKIQANDDRNFPPIRIQKIFVGDQQVTPGQNFLSDDSIWQDLRVEVRNTSPHTIQFIQLRLVWPRLPDNSRQYLAVRHLRKGRHYNISPTPDPGEELALGPNQTTFLSLDPRHIPILKEEAEAIPKEIAKDLTVEVDMAIWNTNEGWHNRHFIRRVEGGRWVPNEEDKKLDKKIGQRARDKLDGSFKVVKASANSPNTAAQLPELKVIQLMEVDGKIPVEIVNARVDPGTPQVSFGLPKPSFSFSVRNNTNKPMNSVVVNMKVSYVTTGGGSGSYSSFSLIDYALHPDISDAWGGKPVPPGGEFAIQPQPLQTHSWMSSITVTLHLDFADFADGTSVGPNQHGTLWIIEARRGAAKYWKWLKDNHADKSKEELERIFQQQVMPPEIGLEENGEKEGVNMFRGQLSIASQRGKDISKYLK